jgi:chromosome segregation ATPase
MAGAAPEAKPPSAAEVDALRKKVATLSAINGALRDENDELRRAVEEASLTGGTAGSDAERRLADAEEAIASLTRQRDELEALLLDRSEDDSQASSRLADAKRRANDREKELERSAREIGALQGERRKLELASADARRERDVAEQKLARAEETARFARERSDADARDAEALIEDLRRRLTRSERDAKAERVALLTQLEAAQTATAAALGEEAQTAVADAEARAAKAERDAAAARAAAAAAEAAAAEAADAAAMEIRGAESRARDAVASGEALDEAVASAVEETARAAERYRRECARAREALAAECERSAALEKELADDRRERSGTIEELTRKVQQASIERQAALGAVRDRASAAEADATRAEAKVVELTETTTSLLRKLEAMETERARASLKRRRSFSKTTRYVLSSRKRVRAPSGWPANETARGRKRRRRR